MKITRFSTNDFRTYRHFEGGFIISEEQLSSPFERDRWLSSLNEVTRTRIEQGIKDNVIIQMHVPPIDNHDISSAIKRELPEYIKIINVTKNFDATKMITTKFDTSYKYSEICDSFHSGEMVKQIFRDIQKLITEQNGNTYNIYVVGLTGIETPDMPTTTEIISKPPKVLPDESFGTGVRGFVN